MYSLHGILQVVLFMTHTINFAKDRLALVLFDALFQFTYQYTNLQLLTASPLQLAEEYFRIFPEQQYPVWTVWIIWSRTMLILFHGKSLGHLLSNKTVLLVQRLAH